MFGPHINIMIDPWQTGKTPPLNYSLLLTQHPDDNEPYAATRYPQSRAAPPLFSLVLAGEQDATNKSRTMRRKKKKNL
jgi:hypothetical protein